MNKPSNPAALRRPLVAVSSGFVEQLVDDVTQIVQRVPYVEVAPFHMWTPGLISELADASDRLAVKVAKLQEAQGADR